MSTGLAHSFLLGNYMPPLDVQLETYCEKVGLKAFSVPKVIFFYAFQESRERANEN